MPFEDRLGALERQGQDEGGVGVGPGGDQERDEPAAVGEVDVDVAEVGFEASAREMAQRDEGLLVPRPVLAHVALDLGIAAGVAVLVAEPPEDLGGGMPLLGRCGLVVDQDLIDDRLERPQERSGSVPGRRVGIRLGMRRGLAGRSFASVEFAGDLADGHAIASSPPNRSVVVHRKHVLGPP